MEVFSAYPMTNNFIFPLDALKIDVTLNGVLLYSTISLNTFVF